MSGVLGRYFVVSGLEDMRSFTFTVFFSAVDTAASALSKHITISFQAPS